MKIYNIDASANLRCNLKIMAPSEDMAYELACEMLDDLYIPSLDSSRVYNIEILGLEEVGQ